MVGAEAVFCAVRCAGVTMFVGSLAVAVPPGQATVAVLVTGPAVAGAVTTSVIGTLAPLARSAPLVQVTVWPLGEQVKPLPAAETKLMPGGSTSVTAMGAEMAVVVLG